MADDFVVMNFRVERINKKQHEQENFDLHKMLGKIKTYYPKLWFDGDLPLNLSNMNKNMWLGKSDLDEPPNLVGKCAQNGDVI